MAIDYYLSIHRTTGAITSGEVRDALLALHADPHRFDAVVTDTHMPGMSGIDLAQEIGRLRPELPVVLVSGRSERSHAELAALGIRHHLDKPFGARELADVLR